MYAEVGLLASASDLRSTGGGSNLEGVCVHVGYFLRGKQ